MVRTRKPEAKALREDDRHLNRITQVVKALLVRKLITKGAKGTTSPDLIEEALDYLKQIANKAPSESVPHSGALGGSEIDRPSWTST